MSFENEYEQWFEENLSEVESPLEYEHNSIFLNKPKKFKSYIWFIINFISILVCLVGSFILIYYDNKIMLWISNLLLSISSGLIASLIILAFTNLREKNISYYEEIIPLLKKRYKKLINSYYYCWPKISIAFQTDNADDYFKYSHYASNTNFVIIGFMEYLIKSFDFNKEFPYNQQILDKAKDLVLESSELCQKIYYKNKFSDTTEFEKVKDLQEKSSEIPFEILLTLESIIEEMENELYNIKFKKKKKVDFQ